MINVQKIDNELRSAGIPIDGCSSDGRIDFKKEATVAQIELAKQILAVHNPIWYIEERRKAYPPIGEQLDMIFHDKTDGTNIWQETIAKIKKDIPKN